MADQSKTSAKTGEGTKKKKKAAEPEKPKKSKLFTKAIRPGGGGFRATRIK